jgi:hypothetical protein
MESSTQMLFQAAAIPFSKEQQTLDHSAELLITLL